MLLDREMTSNYWLVAQATDGGGRWCRAVVQLAVTDVNDNPPVFTLPQYTVSIYEDTVIKALLTRIQAIDPDEGDSTTVASVIATATSHANTITKFKLKCLYKEYNNKKNKITLSPSNRK